MIDKEKVIKGLEVCRDQDNPPGYRFTSCVDDCPYNGNGCARKLKEDAMDQLKEQPEIVRCKDCKFYPDGKGTTKWLPCREIIVPPMWFCADGQRAENAR
jgi:hypothetical protein